MRIYVCDICGKPLNNGGSNGWSDEKKEFLEKHRDGYFSLEYYKAITDKEGNVVHFGYADAHFCQSCTEIANEALWKALDPVIKVRKKSATAKLPKFPYAPSEDFLREDVSCFTK